MGTPYVRSVAGVVNEPVSLVPADDLEGSRLRGRVDHGGLMTDIQEDHKTRSPTDGGDLDGAGKRSPT